MKKLLALMPIAVLLCGFSSCTSLGSSDYPEPGFDKPFSYVIDTFTEGGRQHKDYVKLHNLSRDTNMDFYVYMHSPDTNEWILYGAASLRGHGDTDTIDTDIKGINKYRYFAVESLNGKNYKYNFYKSNNDLHINILDE
jgi:hypothetical protein